ncbi:helix-turn-helix domain-containing protein [Microbulbifer rhizosphaerae]|uniref:DNA-binding transcriptional regulator YiaG n=1 Tax=Microbulbifer rhizosphaerae TaxID=1562603 RepID=A0A7W4W8Q7_9GAMM|nr:helix-turn-helix domain-containing protein [Microbulbifer rhizosphaerae]MBB3059718.1 DNA-binding transcriptional regulator YiaG [Microbulbifer rhizosphaerae]
MYHYLECGLPGIYLENGFEYRDTAYGRAIAIRDIKGLHKAIGYHVVMKADRLNAREIRFLRSELDMSQKMLANTLGVSEITVRKWESDENKINRSADLLLRICYLQYIQENSQVRELVDRLNEMDRCDREKELHFQIDDHWMVASR